MRILEFLPNLESITIFILNDSEKIVKLKSKLKLSPPAVNFLDFDSINCENCNTFLIFNDLLIKNAPSEYWHELLDCWACHNEDYNSQLKGHENGRILAKKGNLLLSESTATLHCDDLRETINIQDSKVSCKNCQKTLGKSIGSDLLLNLYALKFQNSNSYYHKPWRYYFGKILLDSAIVHSNYQSLVQTADSKMKLFIRVIQWDVWIHQDLENDQEMSPNVKFNPVNHDESDNGFESDKSVEIRRVELENLTELIQALEISFLNFSWSKLPNGFRMGYLRI